MPTPTAHWGGTHPQGSSNGAARVLVDGDRWLYAVLDCALRDGGFAAATVTTGNAIRAAEAFSPDAVVLDPVLPDVDGLARCQVPSSAPCSAVRARRGQPASRWSSC